MLYSFTSAVNFTDVTLVEGILFQFCIVSYPGTSLDFCEVVVVQRVMGKTGSALLYT